MKSFSKLSKKSSKNEKIMATRAYLFCLVAGQMFTNTSASMGGAWILELFREFKKYAWGPACLANLYRQLSIRTVAKSTSKHKGSKRPTDHQKTFGGPVQLLQSRRLKSHKTFSTVEVVRKQLDNQDPDNFIWRPYVGFEEELANIVDEEEMEKSVLEGEVEVDSNRHSDEYFQWYRSITRLRIGRFEVVEGATNPDLEQEHNHTQQDPGPSQSHPQTDLSDSTMMEIGDFASHLLLGVEEMKKQPDKEKKIDEFLDRISRKIMQFKSACASRFVEFKMQDCISSSSDEEERKRPKTHPDIGSSQMTPSNVPLEMTMYPIPPSPIHVDSISSQPVEDVLSSPSGFFTPPRPVFTQESVVELSPGESLPSKIIRIKARYRKNTLPVGFQPYQVTTYGARSAEYSLTVEEAVWYNMPPKTYKGKRPAGSSSHFNTERFKDAECAARFESRFKDRTVIFERIVVQADLRGTRFLRWLHLNGCTILMNLIDECFECWVREFYCNIFDATSSGFSTYVRGKTLTVDANRITTLLNLRRPIPRSYPIPNPDNIVIETNEVATVLCGEPTEWDTPVLKISDLTSDYRTLNTFVCNNIEPRSHTSDLAYEQAFLLYCLGIGTSVDIPLTIFESMLRVYHEPRKLTLPFDALICKLMIEAGCRVYTHELPVTRRQKIDGRTLAMSNTHLRRRLRGERAPVQADDAEVDSIEDRLLAIENAAFDQSVQIEQLEERVATRFSDNRNQLTEMFNQLRH
ncbi:hypothetical protein CKAN_00173800 [Cinnamomum micranthum f. kanehirae]|uniref:Uncharacterized protein n=1 Tax=Cinnamomum micranthum f. kanehirae TaxID=337451 RepID=A0A3S3PTZ5_9MAGN|nr:hypothetical protein CKAN_00173800 [Cinnamomum micranthum f. kanehirae]